MPERTGREFNQFLRIEEQLAAQAQFAGRAAFWPPDGGMPEVVRVSGSVRWLPKL